MVEVGEVQKLQVYPLHAGIGECGEPLGDLGRRAGQR